MDSIAKRGFSPKPSRPTQVLPALPLPTIHRYDESLSAPDDIRHTHWTVSAFNGIDGQNFLDAMTIEVEAASELEAVQRAQAIVIRAYYRASYAREFCAYDPALKES